MEIKYGRKSEDVQENMNFPVTCKNVIYILSQYFTKANFITTFSPLNSRQLTAYAIVNAVVFC